MLCHILFETSKAASKAVNLVLSVVSCSQSMFMSPDTIIEHWLLEGCITMYSSALTNAILLE